MAPPIDDVSVQELADLVGVTSQRVYQWIQSGMPHRKRVKSGTRLVPSEAIRWLRERDRAEAVADRGGVLNESDERARKLRAEADMKEMELAKLRREVVPAEEISTFLDSFVGGFASVASGQLGRFEREFVKTTTPGEARLLRQKIHAALMEGARDYADQLDRAAMAIDEPPPDAEAVA